MLLIYFSHRDSGIYCGFNLHFPNGYCGWTSFSVMLSFESSLCILGNSSLLTILVQILYPRVCLSLHSLDSVFHRAETSLLMKSSLWIMPLVLYPKNHPQMPRPSKFSPMLYSKNFTFRPVIHFELTFVKGVRSVSRITFCLWMLFLFSCSVVSDSLRPHELQHARPSCPLPSPGVCSNSCLLSQRCYLTI